jgi:hypothetical protein
VVLPIKRDRVSNCGFYSFEQRMAALSGGGRISGDNQ